MTEAGEAAVIALLADIAATQREIRDALVQAQADAEAAAIAEAEELAGCQHPEEHRIQFSTFKDLNHWVCGLCKFDNKAPTMN